MEQVNPSHGVTKASIRQRIWDYIEKHNLANFPRPVHHRIPNFKGANAASEKLKELDVFRKARTVKVNPDKPQEHARFLILEAHKTLLVPTPRLRTGLFNRILPPTNATKEQLRICSQSQGVKKFSVPVGLDDAVTVDLVIIGSVAVSPKGYRIGKGEGFADMEYAMMVTMGAVTKDTIVITTVHDCQVLDDIPEDLMCPHDLMVDYILTPTQIIQCGGDRDQTHITKPTGILWQSLSQEKFNQIPILKTLRYREQKAGKDVRLKDETEMPQCQEIKVQGSREHKNTTKHIQSETGKSGFNDKAKSRGAYSQQNQNWKNPKSASKQPSSKPASDSSSSQPQETAAVSSKKLFVGGIPRGLRVKDFKQEIREKDVKPKNINWFGGKRFAFLQFVTDEEVLDAVEKLNGITFLDKPVRVELCRDEPRDFKFIGES